MNEEEEEQKKNENKRENKQTKYGKCNIFSVVVIMHTQ